MNFKRIFYLAVEAILRLYNSILIARLKRKFSTQEKVLPKHKMILMILGLGLIAYIWENNRSPLGTNTPEVIKSIDTYIPAGYVLVPIQISNSEALDSIIGSKGVVDLFIPDAKRPGRSIKVAEHIKILRAPLNPNQFAVLVSEQSSSKLVHYEGAFFAIVQNPKTTGTQLEHTPNKKVSSRLIMEDLHEMR